MTRTEEEYTDILVQLTSANKRMEIDPILTAVLADEFAPIIQEQVVAQAMEVITDGGEPVSTMMKIPTTAMILMFQLGVLYGRYEASEFLGE